VVLTRARQLLVGREVPPQEGLRVVMSQEALARRPAAQVLGEGTIIALQGSAPTPRAQRRRPRNA